MKKKLSFVNIIFFVVFGVLTGVLWAYLCPIPLIPGAVHFRTFAFIIVVIGYLFGPVTGFFSGYIGTIVWALLSGNFIPLHSPLADGITVGLSAALPALIHLKGGKKDLIELIDEGKGKFHRREPVLEPSVRRADDPHHQPFPFLLCRTGLRILCHLDWNRGCGADRAYPFCSASACKENEEHQKHRPLYLIFL